MERIQKILAQGGIASRRAAEQLILAGRVRVNGRIVTELGAKANARHDRVEVDGKRVVSEELVYAILHKPRGVVSTMSDPEGRPTVQELLKSIPGRVYPVGRLDFATSGVLLVTNDGDLHDGLLHPRKSVPKTYVLKVKGVMKPEDIEHWRKGIRLEDGMTLPADAKLLRHEADKTWLELTIREGRNQQIRRMGEATGFPVMRLARVAFAQIAAENLAPGRWRHLTREELMDLRKEYGVPRSLPSAPEQEAGARRIQAKPVYVRGAVKGAAGRTNRNQGAEGRSEARAPRSAATQENWGESRGEPQERAPSRGGANRGRSTSRAEGAPRADSAERGHAPARSGADRGRAPTRADGAPSRRGADRGRAPTRAEGAPSRRGADRGRAPTRAEGAPTRAASEERARRWEARNDSAPQGESSERSGGPSQGPSRGADRDRGPRPGAKDRADRTSRGEDRGRGPARGGATQDRGRGPARGGAQDRGRGDTRGAGKPGPTRSR